MSHLVLARKYRPKTFDALVGQDHVVRALTNALSQNRLHHAYLFTGTRGCGKTTLSRILAKSLNCETGITATPCGQCSACVSLDQGRYPDYIEMDAASNRGIADMTSVLEQAVYAPSVGRFKVYMIDEVHMLTKEAFNAMLKTLEEPPAHVKFILATTDPQKVPVTVLSRCLQFNLRQMASVTVAEHLKHVLSQEAIPFDPPALALISRAAAGSMRDALSLTDQAIAYGNQSVSEAEVRAMLGAIDQSYLFEILAALQANNGAGVLEIAQQMQARSLSFDAALADLASLLHQIAIAQTVPQSLADDMPDRARLLALAQTISPETLQLYYQIALLGRRDIGLAPDEFAGFSMTLLRMLAFMPSDKSVSGATNPSSNKNIASPPSAMAAMAAAKANVQATEPNNTAPTNTQMRAEPFNPAPTELTPTSPAPQLDEADAPPVIFDGDWRKLVETHLKLGLARTLAAQCELVSYDDDSLNLRVPESQKQLVNPSYQNKLAEALNAHFGRKMQLNIQVDAQANSPAKQSADEKAELQSNTETAMMNDGFVQALMQDFGAQIIPNTIKPA